VIKFFILRGLEELSIRVKRVMVKENFVPTLKHTVSEKGRVTRTRPHEMAVSNQPHKPMPASVSSAEILKILFKNIYLKKSLWKIF